MKVGATITPPPYYYILFPFFNIASYFKLQTILSDAKSFCAMRELCSNTINLNQARKWFWIHAGNTNRTKMKLNTESRQQRGLQTTAEDPRASPAAFSNREHNTRQPGPFTRGTGVNPHQHGRRLRTKIKNSSHFCVATTSGA